MLFLSIPEENKNCERSKNSFYSFWLENSMEIQKLTTKRNEKHNKVVILK